jgi:mannose-6-phosphate isomerase
MLLRKLEPDFREKPEWGATHLQPWFPNTARRIGEVWFQTPDVPLLVKFLFSTDRLSVQVHPDDAYAWEHHRSPGKTEMWHVLAAEPGAQLAIGFRGPITLEQARAAALSGEIVDMLAWREVAAGDTFFIPAGTVHAIGAGLTMCEIQQLSDITYRFFDYHRGRELHLEHALAVSRLGPHLVPQTHSQKNLIAEPVACAHFITERLEIRGSARYPALEDRSYLLIVIGGEGWLGSQAVRAGEVWHVPAGSDTLEIRGDLSLLRTSVPRL